MRLLVPAESNLYPRDAYRAEMLHKHSTSFVTFI